MIVWVVAGELTQAGRQTHRHPFIVILHLGSSYNDSKLNKIKALDFLLKIEKWAQFTERNQITVCIDSRCIRL